MQAALGPGPGHPLPRQEPTSGWSLAYSTGARVHAPGTPCTHGNVPGCLHDHHPTGEHGQRYREGITLRWERDPGGGTQAGSTPAARGPATGRDQTLWTAGTTGSPILHHLTQKPKPDSVQQQARCGPHTPGLDQGLSAASAVPGSPPRSGHVLEHNWGHSRCAL